MAGVPQLRGKLQGFTFDFDFPINTKDRPGSLEPLWESAGERGDEVQAGTEQERTFADT